MYIMFRHCSAIVRYPNSKPLHHGAPCESQVSIELYNISIMSQFYNVYDLQRFTLKKMSFSRSLVQLGTSYSAYWLLNDH